MVVPAGRRFCVGLLVLAVFVSLVGAETSPSADVQKLLVRASALRASQSSNGKDVMTKQRAHTSTDDGKRQLSNSLSADDGGFFTSLFQTIDSMMSWSRVVVENWICSVDRMFGISSALSATPANTPSASAGSSSPSPSENAVSLDEDGASANLYGQSGGTIDEVITLYKKAADLGSSEALAALGEMYLFAEVGNVHFDLAATAFQRAAELGNADAQNYLSFMYSLGLIGEGPDEAQALVHAYFASLGGNIPSQLSLGYRHLTGHGVPKSCEASIQYYSQVANVVAQKLMKEDELPEIIDRIRILDDASKMPSPEEDEDVVQYYRHAADNGDVHSQVSLGHLHYFGARGVERDHARAARYYRAAADQGNVVAMTHLGQMHVQGHGVPQDHAIAFKYFINAAAKNVSSSSGAHSGLGFMYLHGAGTEKDEKKAVKHWKKAAEMGNSEAQFNLGALHFGGLGGLEKSYPDAMNYFSRAGQQGHVRALFNLGQMHLHGLGTMRSCDLAVKLMKTVAERGPWSSFFLDAHKAYAKGERIRSSLLYAHGAEQGHEVAQSNSAFLLGQFSKSALPLSYVVDAVPGSEYMQNVVLSKPANDPKEGVAVDVETSIPASKGRIVVDGVKWIAFRYLSHAAEQGSADAIRQMGDFAYYGYVSGVPDYKRAVEYYRQSADEKNSQAAFNLGYMHEKGIGLPRDLHMAKRLYDQSFESSTDGHVPASIALYNLAITQWYEEKMHSGGSWSDIIGLLWKQLFPEWKSSPGVVAESRNTGVGETKATSEQPTTSSTTQVDAVGSESAQQPGHEASTAQASEESSDERRGQRRRSLIAKLKYGAETLLKGLWSFEDMLLLFLCLLFALLIWVRANAV